jgi:hypothetical protein
VVFADTATGAVTLLFGFLGVLAQLYGIRAMIVILAVLGIVGAAVRRFPPEAPGEQFA